MEPVWEREIPTKKGGRCLKVVDKWLMRKRQKNQRGLELCEAALLLIKFGGR